MNDKIPFDQIRGESLAQARRLLRSWFPQGKIVGREFQIGNINGDPGKSLSINLDTGRWADFADKQKGSDLIGLRATMIHGGDRVAAAIELAALIGIAINGGEMRHPPAKRESIRATKSSDHWLPIIPPPAGTPRPADKMLAGFDSIYEYTDLRDQPTHYVGRIEARGERRKEFVPIVFGFLDGVQGWHRKAPAAPRPLYGLNRLATMPDATVILCEGEKAADCAQQMFPSRACVSWFGGTAQVEHADFSPLQSRNVILWPDADAAGRNAADKIKRALPHVHILRVDDLAEGYDAADVHPDDPEVWLAERLQRSYQPGLREFLAIEAWADRSMPEPVRLLGDLLTTTSRMFLVGRTGLGKTLVGFAMACGIANGRGFLHWRSTGLARVLYIDGEMPGELIKVRSIDALRRAGTPPPPNNLVIYSRDSEDDFAARFPTIGRMPPLNTEAGRKWLLALIGALGGVDVVIFDNVMSLIAGDQKDEVPWSETTPLVSTLTAMHIAQVWLDHTGHNTERQYGSATKAWRFDAVGLMTPLPEDQRDQHETAFKLSFEHPGKARRRTPDNWRDFETCTIRLKDDRWMSEPTEAIGGARKISPTAQQLYRALLDALAVSEVVGRTTRALWYAEAARGGLTEPLRPDDGYQVKDRKQSRFRKYLIDIKSAGLIGVDGDTITHLRNAPR